VLTVAGVNVALGLIASEAASRRDDHRTFLVSMALLASAGFLGLHALATPGILLDDITAGFSVAARVGLLLAAGFAAVSALGSDTRVVRVLARNHRRVRTVLWVILAAWAIASLARVPLLDRPLPPMPSRHPLGSWPSSVSCSTASPPSGTRSLPPAAPRARSSSGPRRVRTSATAQP
jgi:adenylate cyclase